MIIYRQLTIVTVKFAWDHGQILYEAMDTMQRKYIFLAIKL